MEKVIYIVILLFSSLATASNYIDLDSVNNNLDNQGEYIFPIKEQQVWWSSYNEPARTDDDNFKKKYERIYVRNQTKSLNKNTNDWICSVGELGGEYKRGLKGIVINVYDSNGWWYAKASSYNSDNWASAICWER